MAATYEMMEIDPEPVFPLFDLPAELREKIYGYALVRPKIHVSADRVETLREMGRDVRSRRRISSPTAKNDLTYTLPSTTVCEDVITTLLARTGRRNSFLTDHAQYDLPNVALLRVSKLVWEEAAPIFYRKNIISISPQVHFIEKWNKPDRKTALGVDIAQAFLADRSDTVLGMIQHLEVAVDVSALNDGLISGVPTRGTRSKWHGLMCLLRERMNLKHLSLVAQGSLEDMESCLLTDEHGFSTWGTPSGSHGANTHNGGTGLSRYQQWNTHGMDKVISDLPIVPRLSITLVLDALPECPRVRKGLQHDEICFKVPSHDSHQLCEAAFATALSTLWVQMLRSALLGQEEDPEVMNTNYGLWDLGLRTRNIRGHLFREIALFLDPDVLDLGGVEGRHTLNLVLETDDHASSGTSQLGPVSDVIPMARPYQRLKSLQDSTDPWEAAITELHVEEQTEDAFEAIGGSENVSTNEELWELIF